MNFSPFGGHFPASIPTIHQFAAKFGSPPDGTLGGHSQDLGNTARYHGSVGNGGPTGGHFNQHHGPLAVPVNMGKFRNESNVQTAQQQQHNMMNAGNGPTKYHAAGSNLAQHYGNSLYGQQAQSQQQAQNSGRVNNTEQRQQDKRNAPNVNYGGQQSQQDLCVALLQQQENNKQQQAEKVKQEQEAASAGGSDDNRPGSNGTEYGNSLHQQPSHLQQTASSAATMPATWQSLAAPGSTVADYLSHLPASTLPLSLHHFLKYSAENIKKETVQTLQNINTATSHDPNNLLLGAVNGNVIVNQVNQNGTTASSGAATVTATPSKKKKKKKAPKEKKPRPKPGEIRLTTALDGSTLYCCPECHMAYPEKDLLEQHLVGHTLERRFVCDICGAGLKRKDHLTRHKQSHNPERPYVCTVCLKAFKRKEQLTLHFVIHSGEKRHVCPECGKGFYRKDHLRKHTRSHIARRVKAELSQQAGPGVTGGLQSGQVAAPGPPVSVTPQHQQQSQQQALMS